MQATKETKLKALWRRANRRTPFWKRRPEAGAEGSSWEGFLGGAFLDIVFGLVPPFFGAVLIIVIVRAVVAPIFLSPDFLTVGLADPIGRGFAAMCVVGGACSLPNLMIGAVLAVLIFTLIIVIMAAPSDSEVIDDKDTIAAVRETGAELHELVVRLRADLVLAGVLPLSDEEKAEADDAG